MTMRRRGYQNENRPTTPIPKPPAGVLKLARDDCEGAVEGLWLRVGRESAIGEPLEGAAVGEFAATVGVQPIEPHQFPKISSLWSERCARQRQW